MKDENDDSMEINLGEMFAYMLKRWYVFLLVMAGCVLAGLVICLFMITPKYKSTTKIIVLGQSGGNTVTYEELQLSKQLAKDYEELILSRDVLEAVINDCSLDDSYEDMLDRIDTEVVTDTRIITITAEDTSPDGAQEIAKSLCETAADHIGTVADVSAVNIVEKANLPENPSSPSTGRWVVFSALFGFIGVFVILLIRFIADDRIKSGEDVEKYLELSTLALIPIAETASRQTGGGRKTGKYNNSGRTGGRR